MQAYSIGRVAIDDTVPSKAEGAADSLRQALDAFDQNHTKRDKATDLLWEAKRTLFDAYGFGSVGDSNSVWGRQERLVGTGNVNALHEAAEALGFIPQSVDETYPQPDEERTNVFVPKLERYFAFDHPMNHPTVDVAVVQHTTYKGEPTHIEVGAPNQSTLQRLNVGDPTSFASQSILHYDEASVSAIETALQEQTITYGVFNGHVGRLPLREWRWDADGEYCLYLDRRRNSLLHATKDGQPACGTSYDETLRPLLPETIAHIEQIGTPFERCQHPACQRRFES